jgi:hypothetical protein
VAGNPTCAPKATGASPTPHGPPTRRSATDADVPSATARWTIVDDYGTSTDAHKARLARFGRRLSPALSHRRTTC